MSGSDPTPTEQQLVDKKGPWPFVTRRLYRGADDTQQIWSSRHHRKGLRLRDATAGRALASKLLRCLWMPQQLNWWIGTVFALGSLLFALASVLSLAPALAQAWSLD